MRILFFLTMLGTALYAEESRLCQADTVRGTYGYTISGTTPNGPVVGVGVRHYDGQGHFTQVDTVKGGITGTTVDTPASGTYTINPDCTGSMFLINAGGVAELRLVVVNDGKEVRWIVLTPAVGMIIGNAVRL
jgi:hypothetical protein